MSPAADTTYDIVIVGGGPAGGIAALNARRLDARVLLIEKQATPQNGSCAGWIGPDGVALCTTMGITPRRAKAATFSGLTLHSWDFRKNARVEDEALAGWVVDRAALNAALRDRAKAERAEVRNGVAVVGLRLGEELAELKLDDGSTVYGSILLIADGSLSAIAELANLEPAGLQPGLAHALFQQCECKKGKAALDVAIGASRAGQIAAVVRAGTCLRVAMITRDDRVSPADQFLSFCAAAKEAGVLPDSFTADPSEAISPGGVALDLHTHVGKRCLLIGDAGGFVSAFSHEGIFPAMKSGWLAAETAVRALGAPVVQDELATFGPTWRGQLADYLRMPNTDLGLLMPLVFGNAQMSARVARAFLLGQGF